MIEGYKPFLHMHIPYFASGMSQRIVACVLLSVMTCTMSKKLSKKWYSQLDESCFFLFWSIHHKGMAEHRGQCVSLIGGRAAWRTFIVQ